MNISEGFRAIGDKPVISDYQVQDLYAVRQYQLLKSDSGKYHLAGISYPQEVASGINVAQCRDEFSSSDHATVAPDVDCRCGFYVYDTDKVWMSGPMYVRAVVRVSGKVVVCEWGLRAGETEIVAMSLESQYAVSRDRAEEIKKDLASSFPGVDIYKSDSRMLKTHPVNSVDRGAVEVREDPAGMPMAARYGGLGSKIDYNRAWSIGLFITAVFFSIDVVKQFSEKDQALFVALVGFMMAGLSFNFTFESNRARGLGKIFIDSALKLSVAVGALIVCLQLYLVVYPPAPVDYRLALMRPSAEAETSIPPLVAAPTNHLSEEFSYFLHYLIAMVLLSLLLNVLAASLLIMLRTVSPFSGKFQLEGYDRIDVIPAVTRDGPNPVPTSTKG